jgi:alpha-beta hydrolase superfamily lysophospholipase
MTSYRVRLTGQAINLAALAAPALAGRLAFDLFSRTDPPEPATDKARALMASAQAEMAQARRFMVEVAGGTVAMHHFAPTAAPSGARYLLIHGWGSRIDYLQALVGGLRQAGAEVVGLDLPGHGGSSGRRLTVPMGLAAIDAAWQQFGGFDAMVGHSFGGYCAAMAAAGPSDWVRPLKPQKLALVAAPVAAEPMFADFGHMLALSSRARRALDNAVEMIAGRPVEFFAADTMLARRPDLPVLVLHAEDDKEVGAAEARRYAAAGPHVRLDWMNGLGHRRIVSAPAVVERITQFLSG